MPGLLELGPMSAEIAVMGRSLTIYPLSVDDVITLFTEFPQLIQLLTDSKTDRASAIQSVGPLALGKVIACATHELKRPGAVEAAMRIGVGKQTEILDKVFEISFEDGIGPFVERLMRRTSDINQLNSSGQPSSAPLSAALVGDEPRPLAAQLRRGNSRSGSTVSRGTKQSEQPVSQ